jgi:hypothetical protein
MLGTAPLRLFVDGPACPLSQVNGVESGWHPSGRIPSGSPVWAYEAAGWFHAVRGARVHVRFALPGQGQPTTVEAKRLLGRTDGVTTIPVKFTGTKIKFEVFEPNLCRNHDILA